MSVDTSVLEDPAADEAYTYLRRTHEGMTVEGLSATCGITPQEAQIGLQALVTGGFAREDGDLFFALGDEEETPDVPGPTTPTSASEAGSGPEDAPKAQSQPRRTPGSVEIRPDEALAMLRGERIRMVVRAVVESVDGKLEVLNVLEIEEVRMPGERPAGE